MSDNISKRNIHFARFLKLSSSLLYSAKERSLSRSKMESRTQKPLTGKVQWLVFLKIQIQGIYLQHLLTAEIKWAISSWRSDAANNSNLRIHPALGKWIRRSLDRCSWGLGSSGWQSLKGKTAHTKRITSAWASRIADHIVNWIDPALSNWAHVA